MTYTPGFAAHSMPCSMPSRPRARGAGWIGARSRSSRRAIRRTESRDQRAMVLASAPGPIQGAGRVVVPRSRVGEVASAEAAGQA